MDPLKELAGKGLYSPEQEHDSCGVGVVADIKGRKSHKIIEEGLQVLINLGHRGAAGSDPETGDGAGLLLQMPHDLFRKESERLGFQLPEEGGYGVGMVFLPPQPEAAEKARGLIAGVIDAEGLELLGWRDVPVDPDKIGRDAKRRSPLISQVFVGAGHSGLDAAQLERKLYVVRKVIEHSLKESGLSEEELDYFYLCSLSCNTIVYKGLLMAHQISDFYLDLAERGNGQRLRAGPLPLQHQHAGPLAAGTSLPLPGSQRGDKHSPGQPELDACPRSHVRIAPVRRRHGKDTAHHEGG